MLPFADSERLLNVNEPDVFVPLMANGVPAKLILLDVRLRLLMASVPVMFLITEVTPLAPAALPLSEVPFMVSVPLNVPAVELTSSRTPPLLLFVIVPL